MRISAVFVLLAVAQYSTEALAAGKAKKAKQKDGSAEEIDRLQKLAAKHWSAANSVDRQTAYDVLLNASSFKDQYSRYTSKLQDKTVAWVLFPKNISKRLSDNASFIEHSSRHTVKSIELEKNIRCYVDQELANRARSVESKSVILCIGKIGEYSSFDRFISIGIQAQEVVMGQADFEAWVSERAKTAK